MNNSDEYTVLQSQIACLQGSLTSHVSELGDWKITKCYEYVVSGLEPPYDIADLHERRQAVRDRINELQAQLKALETE